MTLASTLPVAALGPSGPAVGPGEGSLACELFDVACPDNREPAWTAGYESPGGTGVGKAIEVAPASERVYVAGWSGSNSEDYVTLAYDAATGAPLWTAVYDGPAAGRDEITDMTLSPDGSQVLVTGFSDEGDSMAYATLAYDATTGDQLWLARHDGPGHDVANALAVSPDGAIVVVTGGGPLGGEGSSASYDDVVTIAYDASTGTQLWIQRYEAPGAWIDYGNDAVFHPTDDLVLVVASSGTGDGTTGPVGFDWATLAYEASTGTPIWVDRYDPGAGLGLPTAAVMDPSGEQLYVTGLPDATTLAYDPATGEIAWQANLPAERNAMTLEIALDTDATGLFVAGAIQAAGSNENDYLVQALDPATGQEQWLTSYAGPGMDWDLVRGMGVSPDGDEVYVTGESTGLGASFDVATLALESGTGERLWLSRQGVPHAMDAAFGLAVAPDGARVFVTGETWAQPEADDATGTLASETVRVSRWDVGTFAYATGS